MIKRLPLELPPAVARRFLEDMRAFHAIKGDQIAGRRARSLGLLLRQSVCLIWSRDLPRKACGRRGADVRPDWQSVEEYA
jgi:hypothetical protein